MITVVEFVVLWGNGVVNGWQDGVWETTDLYISLTFSEKSDCES